MRPSFAPFISLGHFAPYKKTFRHRRRFRDPPLDLRQRRFAPLRGASVYGRPSDVATRRYAPDSRPAPHRRISRSPPIRESHLSHTWVAPRLHVGLLLTSVRPNSPIELASNCPRTFPGLPDQLPPRRKGPLCLKTIKVFTSLTRSCVLGDFVAPSPAPRFSTSHRPSPRFVRRHAAFR